MSLYSNRDVEAGLPSTFFRRYFGPFSTVRRTTRTLFVSRDAVPPLVALKALCGTGDEGEPVITVMTPEED
jgi:hypothetical protein